MEINATAREINENARAKGFYEDYEYLQQILKYDDRALAFVNKLWLSTRLMLVVSELGEAMEGIRKDNLDHEPGSGGFQEEIADAQIRLLDLAWAVGDPDATIDAKMKYNQNRPHKHGGKKL